MDFDRLFTNFVCLPLSIVMKIRILSELSKQTNISYRKKHAKINISEKNTESNNDATKSFGNEHISALSVVFYTQRISILLD